jgi:hypothetical protein
MLCKYVVIKTTTTNHIQLPPTTTSQYFEEACSSFFCPSFTGKRVLVHLMELNINSKSERKMRKERK